ncbi:hypothetical protein [Nocardioides marmorisolisilvae]|uniref:Uncharacterized protein n=1 Tax=Nocardioides marmorisolisilvae TaxID=1542737 RepID=A0A3N0DW64_9ACTN|nr:hypothetical protein [Nocardioides marmorisolisilvae]RNL79848.1 hypothetical protein EFL95_12950 [Nocardioides marmorisolisilvae]
MTAHRLAGNLKFLRPALFALLVLDVIVLGAFAVQVEKVTRTVTIPGAVAQTAAPLTPLPSPSTPVPVPAAVPIVSTTGGGTTTVAVPTVEKPTPSPTPTPTASPTPGGEGTTVAKCPIPLKEPAASGGLQTLISYAPAFGPFRDEAFAAASAYQPLLQLLGPILAQYPQLAPKVEPAFAPFLAAFAGLLDQGYTLLAPLYAPHREAVLDAESKLAAALAPYAQKLATSALGGCVVDLEAALVQDTA